tara:strand:- start:1342 stop:1524 length:183 start_codon:yes stop_codon:yes gene_type:complete
MIKGYETKDIKTSETKETPVVREQGVIFQEGELWCFAWGKGQENFTSKKYAEIALKRLSK